MVEYVHNSRARESVAGLPQTQGLPELQNKQKARNESGGDFRCAQR